MDQADVLIHVTNPTSANDKGKVDVIPTAFRSDGKQTVLGSFKDTFATTATVKNVDQDGNPISGYPDLVGGFDANGKPTTVEYPGEVSYQTPTGAVGDAIPNPTASITIPGYQFDHTDGQQELTEDGAPAITLNGDTILVNHWQVDKATLTTANKPDVTAQLSETSAGDGTNKNITTPTGPTDNIRFGETDADLAVAGYTYTVSVTGSTDSYATLADALAANPTFDTTIDSGDPSQQFVVTYKVAQDAITIGDNEKFYDGESATPVFNVELPTGLVAPTAGWTAADFKVTDASGNDAGPNAGTYSVTLSEQGLKDLLAANTDYAAPFMDPAFSTDMVASGSYTIKPVQVTITAPSASKTYDGNPFTKANDEIVPESGVTVSSPLTLVNDNTQAPLNDENAGGPMDNPVLDWSELSGYTDIGTHQYTLNAEANPNYTFVFEQGTLNINSRDHVHVVIDSGTKTYDGTTALPKPASELFGVTTTTAGIDLSTITWDDLDFDTSSIHADANTATNPTYKVALTQSGIDKLAATVAGFAGYQFDAATDIDDGSFTITPATITITANPVTKEYDGQPYTDAGTASISSDKPVAGVDPVYDVEISNSDIDAKTYPDAVKVVLGTTPEAATANGNYNINIVNADLTITAKGLDVPDKPNDPTDPVNPTTPNDNPQLEKSIVVQGQTKVYDGDDTNMPSWTSAQILGPSADTDFVIPTDLNNDDFDLTGLEQDVVVNSDGKVSGYAVTLNADGIAKIQAANPNYKFDASDVQQGLFVVTPAPVTITGPTATKIYDGSGYTLDPATTASDAATIEGVPAKGDQITYTTGDVADGGYSYGDISGDINVQATPYDIPVNVDQSADGVNSNYAITVNPGQLTITSATVANVTVGNGTKVYDGDASTDQTVFGVTLPTGVVAPTTGWTATDFDTTGITSQDVDDYTIKLSADGLANLKAANPNYDFTAATLNDGTYSITKAPITIAADDATKIYDGSAYTGKLTAQISGKPDQGDTPVYSFGDVSNDIDAGTYDITVSADATANKNYDVTVEKGTLTITPEGQVAVIVKGGTKVYDNDASTNPTVFDVTLPAGINTPSWTTADFDLSKITSQNVGSYDVTLSAKGLADLQAINPNYAITSADVTGAQFTITKAPITITGPSVTKTYDGTPYTGADLIGTVIGKPTSGVDPVYTLGDISGDINAGTYKISVNTNANANGNYDITPIAGKLVIDPQGLDKVPDNNPENPTNPRDPGNNPQLYTSVVVQGATKVYDGDSSNIPETFTVLAPSKYKDDFNVDLDWSEGDFDISKITSQNVGRYIVTLSTQGLQKLRDNNANYTIDDEDVQNGLYVITPAAVTITAPDDSKVYDGTAFTQAKIAKDGQAVSITNDATQATLSTRANGGLMDNVDITWPSDLGDKDVTTTPFAYNVSAGANDNYTYTYVAGHLTITPQGLDVPVDPNDPQDPVEPKTPTDNPQLETSIVIQGQTKVYDGDADNMPSWTNAQILAPSAYQDFKIPTTLDDSDFELSGLGQDVVRTSAGNITGYAVTLSAKGIADLQAANPNYTFDANDVQQGLFVVTPAPVTITAPTLSKNYDGLPYNGMDNVITVSGRPELGDDLVYTATDISGDVDLGNYPITVTANASDNPNYKVEVVNGSLNINDAAHALTVNYVDEDGQSLADSKTTNDLDFGEPYTTESQVIKGYYLTATPANATGNIGHDAVTTVNYVYNVIGEYQITPPDGGHEIDITYPNDPTQPGKVTTPETGIVPNEPGYTPIDDNGNPLEPEDPNDVTKGYIPPVTPQNPGDNTPITYQAIDYTATAHYVDGDGNKLANDVVTPNLHIGEDYDTNAKVIDGYYLTGVSGDAADGNMPAGNVDVTYTYDKIGSYLITPPDGGDTTDVVYPNDPDNPGKVTTPTTGIVPNVPGYTPTDDNGNPLEPVDPEHPGEGYLPPNTPENPGEDTPINYTANDYMVTGHYVDGDGNSIAKDTVLLTDQHVGDNYDVSDNTKVIDGYYWTGTTTGDAAEGTMTAGDLNVTYVYNAVGGYVITPPDGGDTTTVDYPNDPDDPSKVTTPTTGIVPNEPGYTPTDETGTPLVPVDPDDVTKGYLPPNTPEDPGENTLIDYTAIDYTATAHYVDGDGNKLADDVVTPDLHIGDDYSTAAKVIDGYYLTGVDGDTPDHKMPAGNVDVTYTYGKIGSYLITPPDGGDTTDVVYPNDPADPGKVTTPTTGIVPNQPGYTPTDTDGTPLEPVDPNDVTKGYLPPNTPEDPGENTPIKYTANAYTVTAHYVDGDGNSIDTDVVTTDMHVGTSYTTNAKVIDGYYLTGTTGDPANGPMEARDMTVTYTYNVVGGYVITPPDGGDTTTVDYPNDPDDPSKVTTPTTGIVPNEPGYTPTDTDGNPLVPVDPDDVTKGYLPPNAPEDPSKDTPITYTENDYTFTVHYVDGDGNKLIDDKVTPNLHIGDSYGADTDEQVIPGYYLVSTPKTPKGNIVDSNVEVTYTYNKVGDYLITPPTGGDTTNVPYPNDPDDPSKVTTPTTGIVPNVPGYTPTDTNGNPLKPADPNDPSKGYLPPVTPVDPGVDTPIKYVPNTTTPGNGGGTPTTTPGTTTTPTTPTTDTPTTTPETPTDTDTTPNEPATTTVDNGDGGDGGDSTVTDNDQSTGNDGLGNDRDTATVNNSHPVATNGQSTKATKSVETTKLPQTNDDDQNAAAILGVLGMLGAMGLAGAAKKRREDEVSDED